MKPKTIAQNLTDATMKIARVNHYMVGYEEYALKGIELEDFEKAYGILVEREHALKDSTAVFTRAFHMLQRACDNTHNVTLGG